MMHVAYYVTGLMIDAIAFVFIWLLLRMVL